MQARIFLQVYLAFIGALVVFAVLMALVWALGPDKRERHQLVRGAAELAALSIPPTSAGGEELHAALVSLSEMFQADLAVYDAHGALLTGTATGMPPPDLTRPRSRLHGGRHGPALSVRLPDGRWLVARHQNLRTFRWLGALVLLAIAIAVGAYPLVRRITGRLERLQARVDALGSGDLSARVTVEGRDEVAQLATSFNRAAQRIEQLVQAKQMLLASVSHELRTPLSRIRVALELLSPEARPDLRQQINNDIDELDALIDDLLMASRLDADERPDVLEEIDLLALCAEEAARGDALVEGESCLLQADAQLLRRLVRNLLDNASRHGLGKSVIARVQVVNGDRIRLTVSDRGPGVPASRQETVFEPFRAFGFGKEKAAGTGLGLYLVSRIAARYGATVRCTENKPVGAIFEVTFPLRDR